jgi:hypothetical protein
MILQKSNQGVVRRTGKESMKRVLYRLRRVRLSHWTLISSIHNDERLDLNKLAESSGPQSIRSKRRVEWIENMGMIIGCTKELVKILRYAKVKIRPTVGYYRPVLKLLGANRGKQ